MAVAARDTTTAALQAPMAENSIIALPIKMKRVLAVASGTCREAVLTHSAAKYRCHYSILGSNSRIEGENEWGEPLPPPAAQQRNNAKGQNVSNRSKALAYSTISSACASRGDGSETKHRSAIHRASVIARCGLELSVFRGTDLAKSRRCAMNRSTTGLTVRFFR